MNNEERKRFRWELVGEDGDSDPMWMELDVGV